MTEDAGGAFALGGEIAAATEALERCFHLVAPMPHRGARLFIEGAIGSLRNAAIEVAWAQSPCLVGKAVGDVLVVRDYGVGLRIGPAGRLVRARPVHGGAWDDAPEADAEPGGLVPSLASDVATDERFARLACGPVFAGLLANALACHSWLHAASGTVWSGTMASARTVADIAARGRHFPDLGIADLGGMLDGEVERELRRLGWVTIRFPLPPGIAVTSAAPPSPRDR